MNSPRRRQDRPVESVALKIVFRADRETAAKVRESFPHAKYKQGNCELTIEGEQPGDVAEKARIILEKIRTHD